MKLSRLLFTVAILAPALTACVETPMVQTAPGVNYAQLAPLSLNVVEKLVINDSSPTDVTKELQQAYGASPEGALQEWLDKRVTARGSQGSFYVIIKDANLTRTKLNTAGGIRGYFKREQAEKLNGYLNVLLSAEGGNGIPPAEATISVRASETIPEEASASEKERIYKSVLNSLVANFNTEAEKQLGQYFAAYR